MNNYNSNPIPQYKYLTLISMIYITIMLAGAVITYKLVSIAGLTLLAGSFLTPTWFVIGDIVTEIYGYKTYRKLVWQVTLCDILFVVICIAALATPSPSDWGHAKDYQFILGKMPRLIFGSISGVLVGSFVNSYLISKWKILVKGKHYWLRSLTSTIIGELVFTIVTMAAAVIGIVPFKTFLGMVLVSYCLKLIAAIIFIIPSVFIVIFLKKHEGLNVFDYNINYNPFILSQ